MMRKEKACQQAAGKASNRIKSRTQVYQPQLCRRHLAVWSESAGIWWKRCRLVLMRHVVLREATGTAELKRCCFSRRNYQALQKVRSKARQNILAAGHEDSRSLYRTSATEGSKDAPILFLESARPGDGIMLHARSRACSLQPHISTTALASAPSFWQIQ